MAQDLSQLSRLPYFTPFPQMSSICLIICSIPLSVSNLPKQPGSTRLRRPPDLGPASVRLPSRPTPLPFLPSGSSVSAHPSPVRCIFLPPQPLFFLLPTWAHRCSAAMACARQHQPSPAGGSSCQHQGSRGQGACGMETPRCTQRP